MSKNQRVFRRGDDGQRHHERAGRVAASDNRISILRLYGLLTPRGFPVELSSVLFSRDVCSSRETAEEESRLVHVENELDVELFQLLPNLRYLLHHRLVVHVPSFPVQVDVLEAVAILEAMQPALACLELDSHLRRDLCSLDLDHVTTQSNLGFLHRSNINSKSNINSSSNSRAVLISSSFKLVSLLAGQLATRRGGLEQYMRIHNESAWARKAGGAKGRGGEGRRDAHKKNGLAEWLLKKSCDMFVQLWPLPRIVHMQSRSRRANDFPVPRVPVLEHARHPG